MLNKEVERMKTKPVVLLVTESNVELLTSELKDVLSNNENNILVKIMKDNQFNVLFNIDCADVDANISDETFLHIAKQAHEKDITFNQMITEILEKQIIMEGNTCYKKGPIGDGDFSQL
jgi:hypothetical protein